VATDRRAIRWAVESGDVSRVRAALAEQTEGVDSHGLGLLLGISVERGKLSVARALIEAGADGKAFREHSASGGSQARADGASDFTGEPFAPPLFTAVDTGAVDGVRLLPKSGADVNLRLPEAGTTAVDIAAGRGNQTMMAYLHQQGAQIGPRTFTAAIQGSGAIVRGARIAAVRWLLDRGAPFESSERTLLGEAIHQADPDLVRMLLERGEDVLWVNAAGQTALQLAEELHARGESAGATDTDMMHRRSEVLRILREYDAVRLGLESIEPSFASSWSDSISAWFHARQLPPALIIGVAVGLIALVWLLSDRQFADRPDTSVSQRQAPEPRAREEKDFLQWLRSDPRRRGTDGRARAYAVPDVAGTLRVVREAMGERFADLCAHLEHGLPRGIVSIR
jgi:hypothetical protein